jgi:N-acetyl-gamma-glutamylphosphate reductase
MKIYVSPTSSGCSLIAAFDNLGKGAAGNAIANIALMLNLEQKQAA